MEIVIKKSRTIRDHVYAQIMRRKSSFCSQDAVKNSFRHARLMQHRSTEPSEENASAGGFIAASELFAPLFL